MPKPGVKGIAVLKGGEITHQQWTLTGIWF